MLSSSLSMNRLNQDSLVKSWSLPLGKVNLFWVKDGVVRATILRRDGESSCICNILGLQKYWTNSSAVLKHALSNTYAILSESSDREFFLRIAPRICGGGNGHSKGSSSDDRSDVESSYSKGDVSHDRRESTRADKAADTKQNTSFSRDTTDQSSRLVSQKDKDAAPDKKEVSSEKQESSSSNQGSSEESARERVNPIPVENTESHLLDLLIEGTIHVGFEVAHLGFVPLLLHTSDLNKGEEEMLARDRAERMGINISDPRGQVAERSSQDIGQKEFERSNYSTPEPSDRSSSNYEEDGDRGRFDRSDYNTSEPADRSSRDYERDNYERGMDRERPDMSDFRDNMREHAELYP